MYFIHFFLPKYSHLNPSKRNLLLTYLGLVCLLVCFGDKVSLYCPCWPPTPGLQKYSQPPWQLGPLCSYHPAWLLGNMAKRIEWDSLHIKSLTGLCLLSITRTPSLAPAHVHVRSFGEWHGHPVPFLTFDLTHARVKPLLQLLFERIFLKKNFFSKIRFYLLNGYFLECIYIIVLLV